jgi:hypothetical protein
MKSWSFKLDDPPDIAVTIQEEDNEVTLSGEDLNKLWCEMQDVVRRQALRGLLPQREEDQ